jgi:PAS domain S-box-containing protein
MKKKPTREELETRVRELEQKVLERARECEEQQERAGHLQSLLNALTETVMLLDPELRVVATNEAAAKRLGKSVAEMMGTPVLDHLPADVARSRQEWADQAICTGKPVQFQDERGKKIYDHSVQPVLDGEGKVRAVSVCARDVTEEIRALEAMLEREENFRSLAENASDGILITSGRGGHVYANPSAAEMTGYSVAELLGTGIRDLAHPDELEGILGRQGKRIRGEETPRQYETRIVRKDGTVVTVEITASRTAWRGEPSTLVILRDITRRAEMDRELRTSEERFRAIFEGSLDAMFLVDPETGTILEANPAASELLMREQEDIVGLNYLDVFSSQWKEAAKSAVDRLIEDMGQTQPLEACVLRPDGSEVPVEALGQLIQIDGVPVVHGVVRDITERRRMDEDLRNSEEQFRILAEASLAGVFVFQDGRFRYANPALGRIFGYDVQELIGKMGPVDLIVPEDREAANEYARQCVEGQAGGSRAFRFHGLHRDGHLIDCEVLQGTVQYRGGRAMIGTLLDVTDRKRMEEELLKVQKLESIGILAGGIAHDFNNILTAISTNISMARMYGNLEDDISQMLEDAEKASVRARNLTEQLLAFSKGGAPVRKRVPIQRILTENAEFALSGSNVKCAFSIPGDLWWAEVDEGQIGQVVHNLVINAIQAMPEGGVIQIGARNVPPEDLKNLPLKPGKHVRISVADHGIGIPEKHLEKVFDPFFTTKQKGRGLGLTTSFTIVRNHDGYIRIDAEAGVGTTVHVFLPASDQEPRAAQGIEQRALRGRGRILLIDDEAMIRRSAGAALRRLGYEVADAADGQEGVNLYQEAFEEGRAFDGVLLDLTIPGGMGGKEALRRLLQIDPAAKVIASSGYSSDPVMADYKGYGFCEVIVKPYRIDDLNETLHKVIAQNPRKGMPAG